MENTHLSRRVGNAKKDLESIIDELVSEIEELEKDKEKLHDEINSLLDRLEQLEKNNYQTSSHLFVMKIQESS